MDKKVKSVLNTYHKRIIAEDALMRTLEMSEGMKRRDEFLLSVGEDVGVFINALAKSAKSKVILEVGTSYGYSTIWLAEAAKANGGKVISLEIDPKKAAFARKQLEKAGLADCVDLKTGDALASIAQITEGVDFVLLDIWKELYIPCFDLFFPKLNKNAWIVADNIIFPKHHNVESAAYRQRVKETAAFDSVLLPLGSGLELSQLNS